MKLTEHEEYVAWAIGVGPAGRPDDHAPFDVRLALVGDAGEGRLAGY